MTKYSVVIPAWNAAATIAEALTSVSRQTAAPSEIIVVDDGSTDATAVIAAAHDIRVAVIRQDNQGPGAAMNAGVANCTNNVIAFLDADDLWLPDKMAQQLPEMAKPGGPRIVGAKMRQFRDGQTDKSDGEVRDGLTRSTMVLKADTYKKVGPAVDPPGKRGDLVDWLGRARHAGIELLVMADVLALRRIRRGSLSHGRDKELDKGYLMAARAALLRNRKSNSAS